jgi:hypothetical protein
VTPRGSNESDHGEPWNLEEFRTLYLSVRAGDFGAILVAGAGSARMSTCTDLVCIRSSMSPAAAKSSFWSLLGRLFPVQDHRGSEAAQAAFLFRIVILFVLFP